jgi:hypothetical protein
MGYYKHFKTFLLFMELLKFYEKVDYYIKYTVSG